MYDIIDLVLQSLERIDVVPDDYYDDYIFFQYRNWPCFCIKNSPFSIRAMIYLYSSDFLGEWADDNFRLEICERICSYNEYLEETLSESDGTIFVTMQIAPIYGCGDPAKQVYNQLETLFNVSLPRAKEYIGECPCLRDALGQYAHWGWIPPKDRIRKEGCWDDMREYTEGLVAVSDQQGHYGFLDAEAQVVIPCRWAYAQPFSEGYAAVENFDGRYGFIDRKGNIVIPCEWYRAEWFSEGLAAVMSAGGEWGYVDTDAMLVIPCEWSEAGEFHDGEAQVLDTEGNLYIINRWGNIISF